MQKNSIASLLINFTCFIAFIIGNTINFPFIETGAYESTPLFSLNPWPFDFFRKALQPYIIASLIIHIFTNLPHFKQYREKENNNGLYINILLTTLIASLFVISLPYAGGHFQGAVNESQLRLWYIFGAASASGLIGICTRFGSVNGLLLFIVIKYLFGFQSQVIHLFRDLFNGNIHFFSFITLTHVVLLISIFAFFYSFIKTPVIIEKGERKLPLKLPLNPLGIVPIILSSMLIFMFINLLSLISNEGVRYSLMRFLNPGSFTYLFLYGLLIIFTSVIMIPISYSSVKFTKIINQWGCSCETTGKISSQIWIRSLINMVVNLMMAMLPFIIMHLSNASVFVNYLTISIFTTTLVFLFKSLRRNTNLNYPTVVKSFETSLEAELCVDFLKENDIVCTIKDSRGIAVFGTLALWGTVPPALPFLTAPSGFGGKISILVEEGDLLRAREIIRLKISD